MDRFRKAEDTHGKLDSDFSGKRPSTAVLLKYSEGVDG